MSKVQCKLVGEDGNIFSVLGKARLALKRAGQEENAQKMTQRVTSASSYDEALGIIWEYVEEPEGE